MARESWTRLTPGAEDCSNILITRPAVGVLGDAVAMGRQEDGIPQVADYRTLVLDIDEQAALPRVKALIDALTGHEDKSLWWLSYVGTLVRECKRVHDWDADDDPDATAEAFDRIEQGVYTLADALASLGVEDAW